MSERIFDVDLEDFTREVIEASRAGPMLVDFWADWCAPCHALAPQLHRALDGFDSSLRLAKVEVDAGENMKLAGRYGVRGFPTVILFRDGAEVARFSGARPAGWIDDWLARHLDG